MTDGRLQLVKTGGVRVRIAPSPTGPLHIGTARTALFNYLFAKHNHGTFILRIEDTDQKRSKAVWEKDMIENLHWLALNWDEGPDVGGSYGPYRQSQRVSLYKRYIEELLDKNKAYRCFCTPEELEAQRQYQLSIGEPPLYSGKCRTLSEKEIAENLKNKKPFVIRLKTPNNQKIIFNDAICGRTEFNSSTLGDFIIAKGMDQPLYNLAVVIDDYEMKITHVIRGADHISNTPKQLLIYQALGLTPPQYAHLPLVLSPDRRKLSKREAVVAVKDYREEGYLPQALLNFIALLGWNSGENKEIYSLTSLIENFSLDRVQKSGAIFDVKRLNWVNGYYIRQESLASLTTMCVPFFLKANLLTKEQKNGEQDFSDAYRLVETGETISFAYLEKVIGLYQERLKKLGEVVELTDFFFRRNINYDPKLLLWKDQEMKEVKNILERLRKRLSKVSEKQWTDEFLKAILLEEADRIGDRGKVLWPFRVALTGKAQSAGPFEIASTLGKTKVLARLDFAIKQ